MSNETTQPTHGVFYTDGGCDNPHVAGWGLHGYLFLPEPAKQGTGNPKALPTATGYKTGATGKPDISLTHYVDAFGAINSNATNNVAELQAGLSALNLVKQTGIKNVHLMIDSKYVMDGFDRWMYNWKKADWLQPDGSPRANAAMWQQMYDLKSEMLADGIKFTTQWVKGHSGEFGNERADTLATAGKMAARNNTPIESIKVVEAKGFWSAKSERNRMLSLPNWYFAAYGSNAPMAPGDRHGYYIGTIRTDVELIGKAIADASFAVVYLKERDPVLDIVKAGTEDMYVGRPQGVMVGYLDEIFKPALYEQLSDYGRNLLLKDRRNRRLSTQDKKVVLHEANPPGLSFRLMDHLGILEDRLQSYLKSDVKTQLRTTDLTTLIYETTTAKSKIVVKLSQAITTGTKSVKVEGNYFVDKSTDKQLPITLTVAQDLPDRNTLSALAVEGVKVTLLTWPESTRAVRFAVVIEANGDVGIWAGPYSNLQMLPFS
ncbi:ribonuclease HI [Xanthomonas phage vB_XciM_LucasX]|nr:ribonuclease HI [Xanthomonas phage vB_XciM_LucasX]